MSVAHDAVSESHTGTTGSTSAASFTWNHVPTGTPRSALVYVFSALNATNPVTSVTYGGTTMTAVPYTATDTDTEAGSVKAYFLDNVASGTQAVVVNRTNNATIMYAVCYTVTAAGPCEVYAAGVKTRAGSAAEQTAASSSSTGVSTSFTTMSLTDGSPGTNSVRFVGLYSGASSVGAAATGCTLGPYIDFGAYVIATYYQTTASQGTYSVGTGVAISDDLAVIGLAVREAPNARSASITATGGGVAAEVGAGGRKVSAVATGRRRAARALAPKGAHVKSVTATGGGVLTSSPVSGRLRAVAATGGGVATLSARSARTLAAQLSRRRRAHLRRDDGAPLEHRGRGRRRRGRHRRQGDRHDQPRRQHHRDRERPSDRDELDPARRSGRRVRCRRRHPLGPGRSSAGRGDDGRRSCRARRDELPLRVPRGDGRRRGDRRRARPAS